ncbi:hypothetical protein MKX01_029622 [Papaver californicum]|nr:hypothetical protein MKX01_029622 [Papaver californicum]
MSMSDSDSSSSHGGNYKNFIRQISRDRLLFEMLQSTKTGDSKSTLKVLIMDEVTVKVMSSSCKMADIIGGGVPLVEDLHMRRQPMPTIDAIYFIQPLRQNVAKFLSDMSGRQPLHRKAFVFFSSPLPEELLAYIKSHTTVRPRISGLKEMNLEYIAVDSQGFVTDNERALDELYGENVMDACLNVMANRIATVFASLREFPFVRYRAAKIDAYTLTTMRDLVPTKLAAAVWNQLTNYKDSLKHFPQTETCELLILDRSVDLISPIVHEWTYDAMCHDLLNMDGSKYVYEVPSKTGGKPEKKDVLLEDHDPVWLELCHAHIADASERLHEQTTTFISKNKVAQIHYGSTSGGDQLSTRYLQKMVQPLPQYSEQIDKLSLHVEIAGEINRIIREMGLTEFGQLEQDLVFGNAGPREVMKLLRTKQDATRENKLRLMMIYSVAYPEKFEGEQGLKLMQLAGLSHDDMNAVNNTRLLDDTFATEKKSTGDFSLMFSSQTKKRAIRKERKGEEETWALSRFNPMIEELIEKLNKGELPKNEYACMNDPSQSVHGTQESTSVRSSPVSAAHSMRTRRAASWARPRTYCNGYSSDSISSHASSDFKRMGKSIFIFIIGGATRAELRVCHKLTEKLKREIILGSSSLDDPPQFITKLKMLTTEL